MATGTMARPTSSSAFDTPRRHPADRNIRVGKKEERRDIWSNLLRQTREAQARSRTGNSQGLVTCDLIVCGGAPDEQRHFVQSLARPPLPAAAQTSRNRDQRPLKPKGELVLSNRYAYGYGHLTLFSASQQGGTGGVGGLGQESEEVARVEVHTVPEPEEGYGKVLRGLLVPKQKQGEAEEQVDVDGAVDGQGEGDGSRRPALCLLLSWKEPWKFLRLLRAWLQLLASSLQDPSDAFEDPLDLLKEHRIPLTVVVQHTEAQIALERDNWKEERFDYVSQLIRTAILPLSGALLYMSSTAPPQQPGSTLTEAQKVVYSSLGLDLSPLSPPPAKGATPAKREDLEPRHNVVDRMAICVPHGWDSVGKIRLLSETFSPEEVLESWLADLSQPQNPPFKPTAQFSPFFAPEQASGADPPGEEVFGSSHPTSPSPPTPSQQTPAGPSAVAQYESEIVDPNAHKATPAPAITTTTRPEQDFLSEMKGELDTLATQESDRNTSKTRTTAGNSSTANTGGTGSSNRRIDSGSSTGALNELGDVSFNVGGVSYNTISAEAAIQNLRRPTQQSQDGSAGVSASPVGSRGGTPRPRDREVSGTPGSNARNKNGGEGDVPVADLEKYFASLMKKGGGSGSNSSTPTRPH